MIPKFRAWDKRRKAFRNDIFINSEGCIYEFSKNTGYGKAISFVNDEYIELVQSTGLKDKTGKEIFEGDIVHWKDLETSTNVPFEEIVKVEYSDEFLKWIGVEKCGSDKDLYDFTDTRELEVIGNIYENLEWLRIGE